MPWDDELRRLVTDVKEHFGDGALRDATDRAIATLTPMSFMLDATTETDEAFTGSTHPVIGMEDFLEAFRRELKRLVMPQ